MISPADRTSWVFCGFLSCCLLVTFNKPQLNKQQKITLQWITFTKSKAWKRSGCGFIQKQVVSDLFDMSNKVNYFDVRKNMQPSKFEKLS